MALGERVTSVGLISDTHGLLRPEAVAALEGSELIIHAGDIGKPEIVPRLRALAPVVAVRGNVDTAPWASAYPEAADALAGGVRIYVIHNVRDLALDPAKSGFQIVVSGHSHQPARSEHDGVLYVNPGSAGPRRLRLPVTVARIDLGRKPWEIDFIRLLEI
jgi:putative phosphoesterase